MKTLGRQAKDIWTDCWNTFGCRCCLVSSKRDAGRGTQSLCLRRSRRTNGFASRVGSACVGQLNRSRKSRKNRLIQNSCRLRRTSSEVCPIWSSCCSGCTQHLWVSRGMRPTTVPPTRGRNRWRPGENCRHNATLRQEEESEICFARSFPLESALCWNSEQGLNDGNHACSATRKRCRTQQTMSSSSCWSGGTGPEELEKHLILNSNRWRTFDNAHLEIVTFVEAKLGLRIRDSKPSQTGGRGHADPKDVDALNSLASGTGKRKGSTSPRHGCVQYGGAHVQRDCHVHVTPRKGNGKKGSRANHGPRVLTKERARNIRETDNPKGRSTGSKSAKSSYKGKMSNTGSSGL